MASIKDVIRYFVKNYPYPDELSKTRLTKMVYLADWYSAIKFNKQLTDIKWYFDHYGPFVYDVYNAASEDKKLKIITTQSVYGNKKEIIALKNDQEDINFNLKEGEIEILNKVIEETKNKYWNDFIKYVYSTYPIKTQERYHYLNLPELAKEFKENENNSN